MCYNLLYMRLKRLEIFGFKSFGRKVSLEFTTQITSIVGPNGSGKSNVAESIRFVLGEQSMKSMRGKRGEDMIWSGSQSTPRANRASVSIVFDNTKREFSLDFDEVSVTREVFRDGTNQYFINGSAVRLKDIFELLAAVHIGASGHHMISQGEADRILSANPKERRAMIEDALGLKIYQYKRAESERRLEKTEENMKEAEALRREIAPHLRYLKKQVEKVNEAQDLRERLIGQYREYLKREEIYLECSGARLATEKAQPTEELGRVDAAIVEKRQILASAAGGDARSAELLSVEARLRESRGKKDEIARRIGRVEGMIEAEERALRRKEESLRHTEDIPLRLGDVEGVASVVSGKWSEAEPADDIGRVKQLFKEAHGELGGFIARKKADAGHQGLTEADYAELHRLVADKGSCAEEMRVIEEAIAAVENEYAHLRAAIDAEKEKSRDTERELFDLMGKRKEIDATLERLRIAEETLVRERRRLDEELSEAAILLGRAVLDYSSVILSEEEVLVEGRESQENRRRQIERGKMKLEDLGAQGGEDTVKEYEETMERDAFLAKEIEDLLHTAESLRALIVELNEKIDTEFKEGVTKINKQFSDFFRLMFGGGIAELRVVVIEKRKKKDTDMDLSDTDTAPDDDDEDADEEGIDIHVSLPNKKTKGLQMLSGGERALTSIALLFAIAQVNPPPFMVLDETDAALDEANSRKYGDMIENLSKLSQLLVITHNRETMSRAGVLYGVTMGSDAVSRVLSIAFEEGTGYAK